MAHVFLTENIHENGIALLETAGHTVHKGWMLSDGEKQDIWPEIEAILVRIGTVPAEMILQCPKLKIISKHGVGCDNIDVSLARQKNIELAIAAGANMQAVAEHTLMLILAGAKSLFMMDDIVRNHYAERSKIKAFEIAGKSVLIVGYGRVGRKVARLCDAFGMVVRINDIMFDASQSECDGFEIVHDLKEGLKTTDVLTLHLPLTDVSQNMINRNMMSLMPKGSLVINCARGGIVAEADLAEMLKEGHLKSAGVDVFSDEPIASDNPLLSAPNMIFSPHTAAFTAEAIERMGVMAAQNIADFFEGKFKDEMRYNLDALSG